MTALYMVPAGLRNRFVQSVETRLDSLIDITVDGFQVPSNQRLGDRVFVKRPGPFNLVGLLGVIALAGGLVGAYLTVTALAALYATHNGYGWLGISVAAVCSPIAVVLAWACVDSWRDNGVLAESERRRVLDETMLSSAQVLMAKPLTPHEIYRTPFGTTLRTRASDRETTILTSD
jgi:hypothetical protein